MQNNVKNNRGTIESIKKSLNVCMYVFYSDLISMNTFYNEKY